MGDAEFFSRKTLYDREQVAVSSSAVGGTASKIDNSDAGSANNREYSGPSGFKAQAAIVENVGTTGIYYTLDGSTPSSSNGNRLAAGDVLTISGYSKVKNFRAIRQTTDTTVDVSYYN